MGMDRYEEGYAGAANVAIAIALVWASKGLPGNAPAADRLEAMRTLFEPRPVQGEKMPPEELRDLQVGFNSRFDDIVALVRAIMDDPRLAGQR